MRMKIEVATVWGLAPGDWATWIGSVAVAASLWLLAWSLRGQRKETKRQVDLDQSSQAREVGAWIDINGDATLKTVQMTVMNSSKLPVRRVRGFLRSIAGGKVVGRFIEIPVAVPGEIKTSISSNNFPESMELILVFDDDAGVRWQKYGGQPLVVLDPSKPIFKEID